MAGPSPLLGYNTNVRHNGKLYHIQTEDSGVRRPHIITHLFADGGRIVATKKTTYGDIVSTGNLQERVKQMMRDQHKAMFIGLRDGEFDEDENGVLISSGVVSERTVDSSGAIAVTPAVPSQRPAATASSAPAPSAPVPSAPAPSAPAPSSSPSSPAPSIAFDAGALDAAAARVVASAAIPPSVPVVVNEPVVEAVASRRSSVPAGALSSAPAPSSPLHKYEPTRPARPAVSAPSPSKLPDSIFGENLLSEKSLDEVILSYLAEDLDD